MIQRKHMRLKEKNKWNKRLRKNKHELQGTKTTLSNKTNRTDFL